MGILRRLFVIITILNIATPIWATTTRVVPTQDLTYAGVFKIPSPSGYTFLCVDDGGFHMPGITFGPDGKLYFVGHTKPAVVANQEDFMLVDITIPGSLSPRKTSYSSVVSGTIGTWHNVGGWVTWPNTHPAGVNEAHLGGVHYMPAEPGQSQGKFYFGIYCGYCSQNGAALNMFPYLPNRSGVINGLVYWMNADFTTGYAGNWLPSDGRTLGFSNIVTSAPDDWAAAHTRGRSLIIGGHRFGHGLLLRAVAPWASCGGTPTNCDTNPPAGGTRLPYTTLLQYDWSGGGGPGLNVGGSVDTWNGAEWITINGKSSLVVYGRLSSRLTNPLDWWVQYDAQYPTLYVNGSRQLLHIAGYVDPAPRPVLLFFDTDQLAAVAAGGPAYVPQPYAVMDLIPYFYNTGQSEYGIAYDHANQKLYVREYSATYHAVHIFNITDTATSDDTTGPSAPVISITGGAATHTSVTLQWTQSTDPQAGLVTYYLYRNGFPIYYIDDSTGRTYTDNALSFYIPPVEYYVLAVDAGGNKTQSNIIRVDDSNGGNAPINIFTNDFPMCGSIHEAAGAPSYDPANAYSFTPIAKGGSGGNTWSITGWPSGFSINSSTGEITSPAGGPSNYWNDNLLITVTDSAGNVCNKVTRMYPYSVNDRDWDGYTVAQGDPDDGNSNLNPSHPRQPTVGTLSASSGTTSVTLNWTEPGLRSYVSSRGSGQISRYIGDYSYTVWHGTSSRVYTDSKYIGRGIHTPSPTGEQASLTVKPNRSVSYTWSNLSSGPHYFVVTVTDWSGLESQVSNQVFVQLGGGE